MASHERTGRGVPRVWLFDLDNTLHNASYASLRDINERMSTYIERELGLSRSQADALRRDYWIRYGATLLGVVRHHQVDAAHFLHDTHDIADLESRVHGHAHDFAALKRLPGRHYILSNAPRHYVRRVLHALGLQRWFDGVLCVEDMRMFGHLRPKPDARMLTIAEKIIEQQDAKFDPSRFKDRYEDALRDLIARKKKGQPVVSEAPEEDDEQDS